MAAEQEMFLGAVGRDGASSTYKISPRSVGIARAWRELLPVGYNPTNRSFQGFSLLFLGKQKGTKGDLSTGAEQAPLRLCPPCSARAGNPPRWQTRPPRRFKPSRLPPRAGVDVAAEGTSLKIKPRLGSSSVLAGITFGSRSEGDAAAPTRKAERRLAAEATQSSQLLHCTTSSFSHFDVTPRPPAFFWPIIRSSPHMRLQRRLASRAEHQPPPREVLRSPKAAVGTAPAVSKGAAGALPSQHPEGQRGETTTKIPARLFVTKAKPGSNQGKPLFSGYRAAGRISEWQEKNNLTLLILHSSFKAQKPRGPWSTSTLRLISGHFCPSKSVPTSTTAPAFAAPARSAGRDYARGPSKRY